MATLARYLRLWLSLARFSLTRELSFRSNFLVKIFVELLWLAILLAFYETIFAQTDKVEDWDRHQYLFFLGYYFALGGLLETLFMDNCNTFADLVRSGDLDFYLLKPMDEQFLVTCRNVDWSCVPNVFLGGGVMLTALVLSGWTFDLGVLLLFLATFACGLGLAYGFMLLLTSASIWFMRNQSLFEMWWLFTTLMRYPREIFKGPWAAPVGFVFSFVVPIMLVTNVPARVMLKMIEPEMVLYIFAATVAVLWVSRRFFRYALQRYRSASS
ncbi:MAG: ABC-2 family transporter protein, partial [Gemmataceae bacterium]|nr:ABC-2 family transporter protein [Gemmataceae bacterium]